MRFAANFHRVTARKTDGLPRASGGQITNNAARAAHLFLTRSNLRQLMSKLRKPVGSGGHLLDGYWAIPFRFVAPGNSTKSSASCKRIAWESS
jgi:hypothetical protein